MAPNVNCKIPNLFAKTPCLDYDLKMVSHIPNKFLKFNLLALEITVMTVHPSDE